MSALDALRVGRLVVIGKRYDAATGTWVHDAPTTVVADDEAVGHYRKIVSQGHIAPADDATAALVGGRAISHAQDD